MVVLLLYTIILVFDAWEKDLDICDIFGEMTEVLKD